MTTYTGSVRSQGAGCNFLRLFIRINAEFGDGGWPALPAGARQASLHYSAPWRAGPVPENSPAQGPPVSQRPDGPSEAKISVAALLQVLLTSVDVKSSKSVPLDPTLVFAREAQKAGRGTD